MARMIGGPSKYLQEKRVWNKWISIDWMLGMFLAYFVYLIVNYLSRSNRYIPIVLGITMLFVYKIFNKQAWKFLYKAANFRQGLDGEALVAAELKKLPDDYVVIQDVKLPNTKTNIDFVVLGPNGIFAIEVKNHKGNITYGGNQLLRNGYPLEKNFLWQARIESGSLTEYIQANVDRSLYANPILVFSSPNVIMKFGSVPINGVVIIKVDWLVEYIVNFTVAAKVSEQLVNQATNLFSSIQPHGTQP